jgi:hypothetical protein
MPPPLLRPLLVLAILGGAALAASTTNDESASAAAPTKCLGVLNSTFAFEEACFTLLHNGTGGLSLREYSAAAARGGVTLITYNASSAITVYQEALEETGYYVIEYFVGPVNARNESLLSSRTVPLALRPPTPQHDGWLGFMALAPSRWPAGKTPPAPIYGAELLPLGLGGAAAGGPLLLAVQRATSESSPQPADFDALCTELAAGVKKQLPGYEVDAASPFTFTHARYYGFAWLGPFDLECWCGVVKR